MILTESKFRFDTVAEKSLSIVIENFLKSVRAKSKSVFISHKHNQEEYALRLINLLKKYGFDGYVDWMDDNMPIETSGETAQEIKKKISSAHKFILVATDEAISSRWCNWELGYGDAHKYIDSIALLPIKKDHTEFKGSEYLKIYPSIQVVSDTEEKNDYYVNFPDGRKMPLSFWLNS